jgi:hypothetical protein
MLVLVAILVCEKMKIYYLKSKSTQTATSRSTIFSKVVNVSSESSLHCATPQYALYLSTLL